MTATLGSYMDNVSEGLTALEQCGFGQPVVTPSGNETLSIRLNGVPLEHLFRHVVIALREQSNRLDALEQWMSTCSTDLNLKSSSSDYRIPTHERIYALEHRTHTLEHLRRVGIANTLCSTHTRNLVSMFYRKWTIVHASHIQKRCANRNAQRLSESNTKVFLRRILDKFRAYTNLSRRRKKRQRALRVIALNAMRTTVARYFQKWILYRIRVQENLRIAARTAREDLARRQSAKAHIGLLQRYYRLLRRNQRFARVRCTLMETPNGMHTLYPPLAHKTVFVGWMKHTQIKVKALRGEILQQRLQKRNQRILVLPFLKKWVHRAVRRRLDLPKLHVRNVLSLIRRYHQKWSQFVCHRRHIREHAALENVLIDLQHKCDESSATLSSTNTILARVVDRLETIDAFVDRIEREKVGRHEFSHLIGVATAQHPDAQTVCTHHPVSAGNENGNGLTHPMYTPSYYFPLGNSIVHTNAGVHLNHGCPADPNISNKYFNELCAVNHQERQYTEHDFSASPPMNFVEDTQDGNAQGRGGVNILDLDNAMIQTTAKEDKKKEEIKPGLRDVAQKSEGHPHCHESNLLNHPIAQKADTNNNSAARESKLRALSGTLLTGTDPDVEAIVNRYLKGRCSGL